MDSGLIIQMIIASLAASVLYSLIGFIPGTDETSVLMPVSLALILAGIKPIVVLAFFVSAFVTLGLMNLMPALIANLPGGVLSTPMIGASLIVKKHGRTTVMIKKAAVGSALGVIIALISSLFIAKLISPFTAQISQHANWIFIAGAIFLSLISQAKILSLISIIPFAILFQGLRSLYWQTGAVPADKTITTSFFLGITVAPLLVGLLSLLNTTERKKMETTSYNQMTIPINLDDKRSLNPFNTLTKRELASSSLSVLLANFMFVLSPVGLIVLFGESMSKKESNELKQAELKITVMSALAQATYLSGIMISIIALGVPIAPSAIGPGAAFFESPPVFKIGHTITDMYPTSTLMIAFVIGSLLAILFVYLLAATFAERLTLFVLKHIPHEAMLALFISLVLLLAYMDAGLINVFGVLLMSVCCGTLNRLGVGYGVQFMSLYAAPFIMTLLTKG